MMKSENLACVVGGEDEQGVGDVEGHPKILVAHGTGVFRLESRQEDGVGLFGMVRHELVDFVEQHGRLRTDGRDHSLGQNSSAGSSPTGRMTDQERLGIARCGAGEGMDIDAQGLGDRF